MLESFFHENRASRISILEVTKWDPRLQLPSRRGQPGNVISPQKQAFECFNTKNSEEFLKLRELAVDFA